MTTWCFFEITRKQMIKIYVKVGNLVFRQCCIFRKKQIQPDQLNKYL